MIISIPSGTPFQRKVWRELCRIKKGTTITYKELARRVGTPNATRAVANAVGANKLFVTIPCHRVVRSDGGLGGYSGPGGVWRKRELLRQERKKGTCSPLIFDRTMPKKGLNAT